MCKKTNNKNSSNTKIDRCIKPLIRWLQDMDYSTIASCCGHGKYPISVIVKEVHNGNPVFKEMFSNIIIPRTRNFYKKDKQGHYYIPETITINKMEVTGFLPLIN